MIEVQKEKISKEAVDQWFAQWEEMRTAIHEGHSERNSSVASKMEEAIRHYKKLIVDSSNEEAFDLNATYELLPINAQERIAFIERKPGQYACYRQLDELFIETKKRCARLRLKK